ncbi:MAG: ABC transporter ATP-binding protein [Ilumatobacteraceae bacterium]
MNALELHEVSKSFGRTRVVEHAGFSVAERSIAAIVGPSGSGKTTILRMVAGFEVPDAGEIRLVGALVAGAGVFVPPERRRIGFVPQEGALFPHLSVARNVGFGLPRGAVSRRRVDECLELVGLPGFGSRRPHQLSGGQQQRVALARALAPRPQLVVMDEPFSALDAALRPAICADVVAALRADGATAVIVTHDRDEALAVADQLIVVMDGHVVQAGDPVQLHRAPANAEVQGFLGAVEILTGTVAGDTVVTDRGVFPLGSRAAVGDTAEVLIRPGQVSVFPHR